MSDEERRHIELVDAASGDFYDMTLAAQKFAVVSEIDKTGMPAHVEKDSAFFDPRALRFHDLQKKLGSGLDDRRLSVQTQVDFEAAYEDARDGDAPYKQPERFTALNRTTRWADGSGRVALPTSFSRLIGSEDGRDAVALAIRGPVMGEPDAIDVEQDLEALNTSGVPEGVAFRNTGTQSGTGGSVTRLAPSVSVGGRTFFGAGPVAAAAKIARAGGTLQQIRDAARAAAFGLPPPPFTPEGTRTRPPAPIKNAAGSVVPNNHPLGYMWEEGVDRIGLMGTLFTAGALDKDVLYFRGREGTPVNRLAMRHDGHVAISEKFTGAILYKPTDVATVPEGDGDMIKGWMMPDTSVANEGTEVGQETCKHRPVIRVGLKDITSHDPPPPWIETKERTYVDPRLPEEAIVGETRPRPRTGSEELSDDGRFIIVRDANGTVTGVKRVTGGILSPVQVGVVGGGGAPGPSVTAVGTAPGHLAIFGLPSNQLLIGIAAPAGQIGSSGFEGDIPLGLPGGPGTGGPIDNTGFEGGLPLGIPGGTPGGFGFEPQAPQTPQTTPEANAANAARAEARATARQEALDAEQASIDALRAKGEDLGGARGRRMQERADRAQKARDRREARRDARDAFKRRRDQERADRRRRRKEEAEAKRRKRQKDVDDARGTHAAAVDAAQAQAQATGVFGSLGYVVDMTDPAAPVTFGDGGLAAQDEAERRGALGGGSGLGSLGMIGNTAGTLLQAPGSVNGAKNMQGWTAQATYAINSQQVITAGAFGGGGGFLNAPINVVEVVENKPGQPVTAPAGSTIGSQIVSYAGAPPAVYGSPPLNVIGGVHAAPSTSIRVGGRGVATPSGGILTVSRPHTGGGSITDMRPAIFVASPVPGSPSSASVGDAIAVGDNRRFHVGQNGQTKASALAIVQAPGESGHPLTVGTARSPSAAGAAEIGADGGDFYVDGTTGAATSNVALIATGGAGLASLKSFNEDVNTSPTVRVVASTTEHAEADGTAIGTSLVLGSVLVSGELAVSVADLHATTLTMISPTGAQTEVVSEKLTCGVLDPYVVVMVPVAARPAELPAGTPGYWSLTNGGGAGIHTGYYYTGTADIAVGGGAGGGGPTFADNVFRVLGSADATKAAAFEVDGLTAATTRTLTVQDVSGTIALLETAQSWTAAQSIAVNDATNNNYTELLKLRHTTTGTATAGEGAAILFELEDSAGGVEPAARMIARWSTATNGAEDAEFAVQTMNGGLSPGDKLIVTKEGALDLPETATPATPTTARARLFFGSDGLLRSVDDAGVVTPYVGGGGGSGAWTTWTTPTTTWTTATTWTGKYLVQGKMFHAMLDVAFTNTTDNVNLQITLPAGITIDTTVPFHPPSGGGGYDGTNVRGPFETGFVNSTTLSIYHHSGDGLLALMSGTSPVTWNNGDNVGFYICIPIT